MKNLRVGAILCITMCISISSHACYRTSRQLSNLANQITKHHGNQCKKQKALLDAFKQSITTSVKPIKPDALHSIVAAVAHNNKFKKLEHNKKIITTAIDELHKVDGFPTVLSRLLNGAWIGNSGNFSGALGELKAAIEQKKQQKTIIALGKEFMDSNGRTITEIDIETEDAYGNKSWHEVKSRNKLRQRDEQACQKQFATQKKLAEEHGIKNYEVIVIRP